MSKAGAANVRVRDKVDADLPEITDLWVASWQAAMPDIDFKARRAWLVDRMAEHDAADARTVVALLDAELVGFVTFDPRSGYLDQIAVAPAHQRRGIAHALVETAKRGCATSLDLHVNQDNAPAIRFYQKEGFAIAGEDVNPRSGAPVYRMTWRKAQAPSN